MTTAFVTKDSGQRRETKTGSVRDVRGGKGRYDLIPPCVIERLAQLYERGAAKYGDRNWEKGQPISWYLDSAQRHANRHIEGHRDEDHATAVIWNWAGVIFTETMIKRGLLPASLDDRVNHLEPNTVDLAPLPTEEEMRKYAVPTIYIAGPMSGMPNLNHDNFDIAASILRGLGWTVINPADMDRQNGIHSGLPAKEIAAYAEKILEVELPIIDQCHAIALLPQWESSNGARKELSRALKNNLTTVQFGKRTGQSAINLTDADCGRLIKLHDEIRIVGTGTQDQ